MTDSQSNKKLDIPNRGGNVWPNQICPAFYPRKETCDFEKGCWYCRHADFHLNKERALDVGICCWPDKVID